MLDLCEYYGVLKGKKGVIIYIEGKMYGPFTSRQIDKLIQLLKEETK